MKILAIGAHPCDVFDLAGGALINYKQQHIPEPEIICMTLTNSIFSHSGDLDTDDLFLFEGYRFTNVEKYNEIKKIKIDEFKNACSIINAKPIIVGLQDEPLQINRENIIDIAKVIIKEKPDILITHHPNEYAHWDHAETGKAVCRALKTAVKFPFKENHFVPAVYFFGVQFRPENSRIGVTPQSPDILIDLTWETIETKIEIMYCFASQGHNDYDMLSRRMNSFESETGRADGLEYSESFILYQPLKTNLLPGNLGQGFYNFIGVTKNCEECGEIMEKFAPDGEECIICQKCATCESI